MAVQLVAREQRIPPSRGLVLTYNHAGRTLALLDVQRWIRYSRLVLKTDKIDIAVQGDPTALLEELFPTAAELQIALSLRTNGAGPPPDLAALKTAGLFDVFLCPEYATLEALEPWLRACEEAAVPIRLQLQAPFPSDLDCEAFAERIARAGVVRTHLALADPFVNREGHPDRSASESTLGVMQRLAKCIEEQGVESNLLQVPLCLVDEESLLRTANSPQRSVDHAYYTAKAYDLAERLYRRGSILTGKIILMLLSRDTFKKQPMDNFLLPVLLYQDYILMLSRIYRRFTIHLRIARSVPKAVTKAIYDQEVSASKRAAKKELGPTCSACALQRICDHESDAFKTALPGLAVHAVEGERVVSPLHFSALQPKYYDTLDEGRLDAEGHYEELAEDAASILVNRPPDVQIGPHDYGVEETHFDRMESGLKWWSVSNMEKRSTPLGIFRPPLTLSMDIGAGIADYVGFRFGRHCMIVCPMEAYRHNITLHIAANGRYVLLRDKRPVRPTEFEGEYYLPLRLGEKLEPRISIWNIDECIATQNLRIWTGEPSAKSQMDSIKYSVIIVSTRFTRRLHAVLRSLAHQEGFDFGLVEIVICYVPGIDATDDLIDSVKMTYPELRIVRAPFPEQYTNSKGFLINESAKVASGEWIMLLDSDTLLPPDYFAKVDAASSEAQFIAPDGRKLLPKDLTARILMGELEPWKHWEELLEGPGEFRHRETEGIPVGFCQCFRAEYLQRFPYLEMDHFETADMRFGDQMRREVGIEHRLMGTPVIHLDHGGSQWYGTQKHM